MLPAIHVPWLDVLVLGMNGVTESLNVWERLHPMAKIREKQEWCDRLKTAVLLSLEADQLRALSDLHGRETRRAVVEIHRHIAPRRFIRDLDNLEGGTKPLRDGLVRSGLIADDRESMTQWARTVQTIDRERERTIVVVRYEPERGD